MKRSVNWAGSIALLGMVILIGGGSAYAQKRKPVLTKRAAAKKVVAPAVRTYPVTSGTVIRSRMNRELSSKTAQVGDTFTVTITEPVYSQNGVVVVPVGSTMLGRVDMVRAAQNKGRPGEIDVRFTQLRLPNGVKRSINGSLTELAGSTNVDNEGTASGKKMSNRKVIFIGGGGAGGALIGAAIGGGKGALIGGILGAGGGFLGERLTKGPEAKVESGTEFGVYLNQAISLPRFVEVID